MERTWSAAKLLDLGAEEEAVRSVSLTICPITTNIRTKSKVSDGVPRQAEVAQGVPGRLRPRIS